MAGNWGNQERAQFLFGSWSPASRNLPQVALEYKEHRRVSPVLHPPVSQGSTASSEGPATLGILPAQAGPGRPPAPRTSKTQEQILQGHMQGSSLGLHHYAQEAPEPTPCCRPPTEPPHCLLPTQLLEASSAPCPGEAEHNKKEPGLTSAACSLPETEASLPTGSRNEDQIQLSW